MLEQVDLSELVRATEDRWVAIPDRDWRFAAGSARALLADRERMDCALDALIENALKATGDGDRIAVEASVAGSDAVISVADAGHGIPAADLERIFDRFARVPYGNGRRDGGTGLGLPMVRAIVKAHQGTVTVSSEVGRGTTFELHIAALPDAKAGSAD